MNLTQVNICQLTILQLWEWPVSVFRHSHLFKSIFITIVEAQKIFQTYKIVIIVWMTIIYFLMHSPLLIFHILISSFERPLASIFINFLNIKFFVFSSETLLFKSRTSRDRRERDWVNCLRKNILMYIIALQFLCLFYYTWKTALQGLWLWTL